MPWRRLAGAAADEAMKASIAAYRLALRRSRRDTSRNVVTIWIAGGSGPSTVDALDVHELGELLEPELDLALRDQRPDRNAGRRLHDPGLHGVGDAPALEQSRRGGRRSGRSSS